MPESQPMTEVHVLYSSGSFKAGPWIWYHAAHSGALEGRIHMGPGTLYGVLTRMRKEGSFRWTRKKTDERTIP